MAPPPHRSMFWRLWLRSILVRRPQAALAIGSLIVGATLSSTLLNLYGDMHRKMRQEFRDYGPNLVVAPPSTKLGAAAEVVSPPGLIDEGVTRELEGFHRGGAGLFAVPVLYVVARLEPAGSFPRRGERLNAVAVGADFAALRRLFPGWHVQGVPDFGNALDPPRCAIGTRVARRLRLGLGDAVEVEALAAPAAAGGEKRQTFKVASLLITGASEDDQIIVPLAALQRLAGVKGEVSLIQCSVTGETKAIERTLHAVAIAFPRVEVRPIRQIVDSEGRVLGTIRWLLLLLTALILVIVGLCVTATMTAIVLERRKDVAVMKALGASDERVMRLFLAEGAAMGLTGGVAGFILGALLAHHLAQRLLGVSLNVVGWSFPGVCLAMTLAALAATLFPVRMVRGIEPARVLKGE